MEEILKSGDNRMLGFMAGVLWEDHVTNNDGAKICGIAGLECRLRMQRLRWFEHVLRGEKEGIVKEFEIEMAG